jgi:hypothetical protein
VNRIVHRLLKKYGSPITLVQGQSRRQLRAVLQSTSSVSQYAMRRAVGDIGDLPHGQYVYIGTEKVSREDCLLRDGQVFWPKTCEPFFLGGELLCYWGLAACAGKEEQWQ